MDVPVLWWSPTAGLIRGGTNGGYDDAVRLVLEEPVDEKGRGPSYWRGHADGRMAERAGVALSTPELRMREAEQQRRREDLAELFDVLDQPPFAPELADAPLVTGESGSPAPLVVDQPVHDSTLPAETEETDRG